MPIWCHGCRRSWCRGSSRSSTSCPRHRRRKSRRTCCGTPAWSAASGTATTTEKFEKAEKEQAMAVESAEAQVGTAHGEQARANGRPPVGDGTGWLPLVEEAKAEVLDARRPEAVARQHPLGKPPPPGGLQARIVPGSLLLVWPPA